MKRFLLALSCVLAAAPGFVSAALSIQIEPDLVPTFPNAGEQYFDLIFHETGTPTNEGLFAYDLYITRSNPAINLIRAEKPDNWVFTSPGASFQEAADVSNKPGLIVVNAIGDLLGANQDIVDGTKAARVFYTIDPNTFAGVAAVTLDPTSTIFVSGDTGEVIPVDISDTGAVIWVPEPGALPLCGLAGVLLRRRRRVR